MALKCPENALDRAEKPAFSMPIYVLEPPTQYVHPYHGQVIEQVLPLQEARNLCAHMGAPADACAWQNKNKCFIVIPTNGPVSDLNAYRRHEIAHCNGWDHSHSRDAHSEGNLDLGNIDRTR
jgi:hypothetical protein